MTTRHSRLSFMPNYAEKATILTQGPAFVSIEANDFTKANFKLMDRTLSEPNVKRKSLKRGQFLRM